MLAQFRPSVAPRASQNRFFVPLVVPEDDDSIIRDAEAGPLVSISGASALVTNLLKGAVPKVTESFGVPTSNPTGTGIAATYAVPAIYLSTCGAVGNGSTDDTAAFDIAIARATLTGSTRICLDQGKDYLVTRKLDFRALPQGIAIIGTGQGYTSSSRIYFDIENPEDLTSNSSVSVPTGATTTRTFVTEEAHTPYAEGTAVSAQSQGSTARITGSVVSDDGTTIVFGITSPQYQCRGSGTHTDWVIVNETENFCIGFLSGLGCGVQDCTLLPTKPSFQGGVITFEHNPAVGADSTQCWALRVIIAGIYQDGTNLFDGIRAYNSLNFDFRLCKFQHHWRGIASSNGPGTIANCEFASMYDVGIDHNAVGAIELASNTFEPCDVGPFPNQTKGVRVGTGCAVDIHGNDFNDAGPTATGSWLILNAVSGGHISGNLFQHDNADYPPIYVQNGSNGIDISGNNFLSEHVIEFDAAGSSNNGFWIGVNGYAGSAPIVGSNYASLTNNIQGSPVFPFISVDFITSLYGGAVTPADITLVAGGNNNIVFTGGTGVIVGPLGAFDISGISYSGGHDGQYLRLVYYGAQNMTLKNAAGPTPNNWTYLPGGVDKVCLAAAGPWVLDFVRIDGLPGWILVQ